MSKQADSYRQEMSKIEARLTTLYWEAVDRAKAAGVEVGKAVIRVTSEPLSDKLQVTVAWPLRRLVVCAQCKATVPAQKDGVPTKHDRAGAACPGSKPAVAA